jgi:hypothetical protein
MNHAHMFMFEPSSSSMALELGTSGFSSKIEPWEEIENMKNILAYPLWHHSLHYVD